MLRAFAVTILVFLTIGAESQEHPATATTSLTITFHVTSVRYEDDPSACEIGQCYAKKFTVEGYADRSSARTLYVLTCGEYTILKPRTQVTMTCGSVHANNDYTAKVFEKSMSFCLQKNIHLHRTAHCTRSFLNKR